MATQYQVTISMSTQTVQALVQNGFTLYGFKAVQATGRGLPTVWLATQQVAQNVLVSWTDNYQAYVSQSAVIPGGQIYASSAYDIDLGQTLNINNASGTGAVVQGGPSNAICINNQTTTQFTCGVMQSSGGSSSPLCAFTLFGQNLELIAPLEEVFLMFSTQNANPGTVLQVSYGPGIMINLSSNPQVSVAFDINQGWSAGGAAWAQTYPANTNLVPLLIQPSQQLSAQKASLDTATLAAEEPAS